MAGTAVKNFNKQFNASVAFMIYWERCEIYYYFMKCNEDFGFDIWCWSQRVKYLTENIFNECTVQHIFLRSHQRKILRTCISNRGAKINCSVLFPRRRLSLRLSVKQFLRCCLKCPLNQVYDIFAVSHCFFTQ